MENNTGSSKKRKIREPAPAVIVPVKVPPKPVPIKANPHKPKYVRGLHLTAWSAGSGRYREKISGILRDTEINTLVIAVKEYNGEVYVPEVKEAVELGAYMAAMPDAAAYLQKLKNDGIYTVARIVLFKDDIAARKKPEWAVKDCNGNSWKNKNGLGWVDPYNRKVWEYNFAIAEKCIDLGFEEIQFDYVRFPSDGKISECRYSQQHSSTTAINNIVDFLREAKKRIKVGRGANISIDVFGMTTSAGYDIGIGQNIIAMAKEVDFVCPMVYPSHYVKGSFGYGDPNSQPYNIVFKAMQAAIKKMGIDSRKLRPYLQDFSLGYKYGEKEVRDQ